MTTNLSFGKEKRVTNRADYLAIQNEGQKWHSKHFVICYRVNQCCNQTCRLGVTITKKIDKRAVKRNLLRRKIKEIFRLNYPNFSKPLDVVLIAKQGAMMLDRANLQRELFYLFKKIGLTAAA